MKRILVMLAAALFARHAAAADFGMGISAKSDNGLLWFPIDVSPGFRVEPYLRYASSDSKQTIEFAGQVTTFRSKSEWVEGGMGIFGLAVPKESVRFYYGGRASYFDLESRSSQSRQDSYGYRITPTVGFEYLFNSHFTLGGEVGYYFENRKTDTTILSTHQESDTDTSGTESFLILRYFF